jgi:hypothetical protein
MTGVGGSYGRGGGRRFLFVLFAPPLVRSGSSGNGEPITADLFMMTPKLGVIDVVFGV